MEGLKRALSAFEVASKYETERHFINSSCGEASKVWEEKRRVLCVEPGILGKAPTERFPCLKAVRHLLCHANMQFILRECDQQRPRA